MRTTGTCEKVVRIEMEETLLVSWENAIICKQQRNKEMALLLIDMDQFDKAQ